MSRTILHEDERGFIIADGNELTIGSKIDDPPKLRLTAPLTTHGGGGGAISANFHNGSGAVDGHGQVEMGMIRFEQAEDVRGQASNPKCEINFLLNDGSGVGDSSMRKPLAFIWNLVTRTLLYLGGNLTDTMWSPSGLTFTQQQDDGNFVTYQVSIPFNKGANPHAVWSAWTGFIG